MAEEENIVTNELNETQAQSQEENKGESQEQSQNTSDQKKEEAKEKFNDFGKKFRSALDKGIDVSKSGLKTAGKAISVFGDRSVHRIDISTLKSKQEKKYEELGKLVYNKFASGADFCEKQDSDVNALFTEITKLAEEIKIHEKALKETK